MGGLGNTIGTGLDLLMNRPGGSASAVPDKLILSSQVKLILTGIESEPITVAQWDQMRKQKLFDEKKRFKPFGSMKSISLGTDNGWELTLSGQKTDGKLESLIYIYEKMLNGTGISSLPEISTFNSSNSINTKPLFEVTEFVKESNGKYSIYIYKEVSIIGYDENIPSDNNPIEYSLTLFSPFRDKTSSGSDDNDTELETVLDKMINDLVNRNKQ